MENKSVNNIWYYTQSDKVVKIIKEGAIFQRMNGGGYGGEGVLWVRLGCQSRTLWGENMCTETRNGIYKLIFQ